MLEEASAAARSASSQTLIEAVVFDCDGVLLESAELKTQAFADLFAEYPQHVEEIVALHERHGGLSRYTKFDMIFEDVLGLPLGDDHRRELGRHYSKLVVNKVLTCEVVNGAEELLEGLSRSGVPLFVSSGSPQDELVLGLKHHGLHGYLQEAWGHPTSKPVAIDRILGRTGAIPSDVTFVGDAWSDYEAARSRGLRFLGRVPRGHENPFPAHVTVGADLHELADPIFQGDHK